MNLTTTKKTIFLWTLTACFLLTALSTNVAQNAATKTSITKSKQTKSKSSTKKVPSLEVVVYQSGKITFKGREVAFDDLKKEVQRVASTFKNIPDKIPMKTVGEVGMGTRQEVETRISEGIAAAKWVRKKAKLATQDGNDNQSPERIDFVKEKSNSLVWEQKVAANGTKVFVFAAKKGQKLSLSFIDDTNQGSMDLGKVSIEPNTDPYNATIEVTKDYRLSVSNNSDKATSFRIFISLDDPKKVVKKVVKKTN